MAKRVGGARRKSRHKLTKNVRQKGKFSLRRYFQELTDGDKVVLNNEPSYQKGTYHMRHHGKIGTVIGKNGTCYNVKIKDIAKLKTLIVHPVHLKRLL